MKSQQHDYKHAELGRQEDLKIPELEGDVGKHRKTQTNSLLHAATGLPIEIKSSMNSENYTSFSRLDIDNYKKTKTGGMVLQSRLSLKGIGQRTEKNVLIRFTRRTDIMPSVPLETKYHPFDVDILLIKRLITETSKHSFAVFLQHEFVAVSCRTFTREEIGRSKFNPMIGLGDHECRVEALYIGFETSKKRLAKEARVLEIQEKNVALGKNVKDPAATKAVKGREALYYRYRKRNVT
ncbi:hypothetical protein KY285_029059 [Solanum tuberosum]|nr:hypothetical protein KY285_029059 [Solanum tuberosum]